MAAFIDRTVYQNSRNKRLPHGKLLITFEGSCLLRIIISYPIILSDTSRALFFLSFFRQAYKQNKFCFIINSHAH